MEDLYKIENSSFQNPPSEYRNKNTYPKFQIKLEEFKSLLKNRLMKIREFHIISLVMETTFFLKKNLLAAQNPEIVR